MDGIYEYLIGGKKIGKRNVPAFNELEVGDIFYVYQYKKPDECIKRYKIKKIYKDVHSSMIDFKVDADIHWYLPLIEATKTFHKNIDMPDTKVYFATTEDELKKHIKSQNIEIKDINL